MVARNADDDLIVSPSSWLPPQPDHEPDPPRPKPTEALQPVKLLLAPGQTVEVGTKDENGDENDGTIVIEFGEGFIEVRTDWPDPSGRTGVLYREEF